MGPRADVYQQEKGELGVEKLELKRTLTSWRDKGESALGKEQQKYRQR
jgi:hypothetical protein